MQIRALALCVVLLAQIALAQKTSIRQENYHGWNAYILSNGTAEAVVVPQVGRVMQFRFAGEQDGPFWENEATLGKSADPTFKEWLNFGGDKTWPAEQAQWPKIINREWPPPATFDSTPVKAVAEKKRIRLEYPADPHYGIGVTRWVELDAQKNIMRIRTRYEKVQGDPVKVGVWVITQLKDPREVRLYKSAGSSMKDGYVQVSGPAPVGLQVHDWGISLRRDPRNKLKVGSDGDRIEWFGNSWRLRIDAEPRDAKAEYPEQGSSVQVYTNDDPDKYVELETQGPLLTMKKGDKQERVNTYTLTKTDLYNPESLANSTPSKKRSGNLALTKEFCMEARIDVSKVSPAAYRAMYALEQYVHSSKLEPALVLLLKVRASQINGCAYCIDMHWKDARAGGETEQRLYGLDAWREAPYYSERERAAFTWIESLTNITEGHVPDSVFEEAKKVFSEQELVDLAMVGVAINGWNRLAIGFRAPAGTYVPKQHELKKSA